MGEGFLDGRADFWVSLECRIVRCCMSSNRPSRGFREGCESWRGNRADVRGKKRWEGDWRGIQENQDTEGEVFRDDETVSVMTVQYWDGMHADRPLFLRIDGPPTTRAFPTL